MLFVVEQPSARVVENALRLFKPHFVLGSIGEILSLVPLKTEVYLDII